MKKILIACAALFIAVVFVQQHSQLWGWHMKVPFSRPLEGTRAPEPRVGGRIGEVMVYDVRLGKLKLGTSVFHRMPDTEFNGARLQVMIFETDCARLKDREEIYSDPGTFLPVRVKRDIVNMLLREQIIEEYDQKNFVLTITKMKKGVLPVIVRKTSPIQHPILLPHYIRGLPELNVGQVFDVALPSRSFVMRLTGIETVSVPLGDFQAYRFESTPKQIAIWISADEKRLPLKIQGVGVMNYAMVLREYAPGEVSR
jgi:hypothetical protein